jgi:hypothetical protein
MSDHAPRAAWQRLDGHRRTLGIVVVVAALIVATVGIRAATRGDTASEGSDLAAAGSEEVTAGAGAGEGATGETALPTDAAAAAGADAAAPTTGTPGDANGPAAAGTAGPDGGPAAGASPAPGATPATPGPEPRAARGGGGTPLPGVTAKEITVVYYWKGDRTRTSPYLTGTGAEANVDEAEAFRKLVDFINDNAGGGATLMGHPINLHGRRIKPVVVEAGQAPEDYAAAAERITKEVRPMAAVAAHGSISAYLCTALAKAGIHNLATYDLVGDLTRSTNGYCLPSGMTWEQQVELSEGYLLRDQRQHKDRVYGVVYAEYPGLVDSAPRMVERFRRAGINVAEVASVSASLTTAQQQAPNVVARMRAKGVNTIVMPDAGAPLNFTHAAAASGYNPNYFIWPCSGQDTMGMVRLFNPTQWARAAGLTCYDQAFSSDLTSNAAMRSTQWYKAYRSQADAEPPSPTPFVYAALLPLVVGIEGAGPDLTVESFRGALDRFRPYRYDAVDGRTEDATNMLLGPGTGGRGLITDAIVLRYNATRTERGSGTPGAYDFPERRRYATRNDVR